tara:strand:- start:84 stop:743 length:660 start_codon:yes stop_codon:yes gene_type:complete
MERELHLFEELCAKGKAYRRKRMAAGEKSSAYLSGRAVKVCKGQMQGEGEDMKENIPTSFTDEDLDDLRDIVLKYVEDPDDAEAEVQRFDDGGFDNMSDMVTTNLLRDPEYKKWYNNIHSIKESNNMRKVIRKIIREQNFDQRLAKAMGMSDDEFQDKVASRDVSGESMSNADIGALQKLVGNYSLEKILKTIAIIADRGGKNDEAFEIENFLKTFNKE